ncbi:5-amino-6-(5-phospho-D-ribitylamino)uracil phosphatase YigB [Vibrio alfacsensis]|uniref:5-amino-6-(5-phospho-D-ribitylamino)uracil phosphatase YigB n=1 Tax=Vibrio alfacsensis TaxID=1074311 RepID=UPI001BEDDB96|nr:5-amino-6-(5-phospho-D-ribitylamino)uracil phosphatase YigB [Vibrio alfacsensis]BBM63415.1 2-haloalkanoic acid dehalogenase [Vibrio alfacsensis]BCN25439.1 2-haloalkanoic acid dehalogenase [Vibrio alfacsensis]
MKFYRSIPPVKAMTFDLDDTLYDNYPVIVRMEQELLSWLSRNHPAVAHWGKAEWLAVKKQVVEQQPELKSDVTRWRWVQLKRAFLDAGYDEPDAENAAQAGVDIALDWRSRFTVPQTSLDILTQLRKQLPLVAITNGNVDLDRIGLAPFFELVLKAGPDGRAKPEPDLFNKAQQFLDVPAQHILHVGDHLVTDVLGAKQSGYSACWFNRNTEPRQGNTKSQLLPDVEIHCLNTLGEFLNH